MSHSTVAQAARDPELQARVQSAAFREVVYNAERRASDFGQRVVQGTANWGSMYWQVAVNTEAAYASAVAAGRGSPGHDTDVITDPALTAAVAAAWPADPAP